MPIFENEKMFLWLKSYECAFFKIITNQVKKWKSGADKIDTEVV
jgi:hypothetical protein